MKIFYTCSFAGKSKYQKYYDLVLKAIQFQIVELRSPELGNFPPPTSSNHYHSIRSDINWADAVILEISEECFQLGHEATLAIQNKKHVLCLSIHEDFTRKIQSRYFHAAKYSEMNIEEIVSEFLTNLKRHQFDQRFNCFLSAKQIKTLDQNATKLNLTKSDYIRKLIDLSQNY